MSDYIAHKDETGRIQTVKEHCENTARLCEAFAAEGLGKIFYDMGLLHDIGKYQPAFQSKIRRGDNTRVEHSHCGAITAKKNYPGAAGLLMAYCIAGHHSGIPDGGFPQDTPDMSTLYGRTARETEDYSAYQSELTEKKPDEKAFNELMMRDCGKDKELLVDKFAFFTRYAFSCLTDADSLDTRLFCTGSLAQPLRADFAACLERVNEKLRSFRAVSALQKARGTLQAHVFEHIGDDAEIYMMNMPTGSGKTLCSMKFALERALRGNKARIIYVIPYNSIIDQTADLFEELFGGCAEILRHQSTFSYKDSDKYSEEYRVAAEAATENWDAPIIITTAVQFFETVYSNRRGKLRKLHNLANSVVVFDEAHLMPQDFLQPCLRVIAYITKYLGSEALFLTATMPDFPKLMRRYALPDSKILPLADPGPDVTDAFRKCEYVYLGSKSDEALLELAAEAPSSLIIVNTKRAARALYRSCGGERFHLSTYMTPNDRRDVIQQIRQKLEQLRKDFPQGSEVPPDRRITIVSTSLIEAGIDLDVDTVFRELNGLDNILQAGGRCNRDGLRENAVTYVFERAGQSGAASADERANLTRGLFAKYPQISCAESIKEYYDRLFSLKSEDIQKHTITKDCSDIRNIPFRKYAEEFEIIESQNVSVMVCTDSKAKAFAEELRLKGRVDIRKTQNYVCSVSEGEFRDLFEQHAVDDFGTGVFWLVNPDYYDNKLGILFESKDTLISPSERSL